MAERDQEAGGGGKDFFVNMPLLLEVLPTLVAVL